MSNLTSQKELHEQFVSNLNGTSIEENYVLITLPILINICFSLWSTNLFQLGYADRKGDFWLNFIFVAIPYVVSITLLSNYINIIYYSFLSLSIVAFLNSAFLSKGTKYMPPLRLSFQKPDDERRTWLVISQIRGLILLCSAICILAVDTKIFPRRFAKTETYGYGPMDLGVGFFTLMLGVVESSRKVIDNRFKKSMKSVGILILLGLIRLVIVKMSGYHEHRTEYGYHWNFFFTLACVRLVSILCGKMSSQLLPVLLMIIGVGTLQHVSLNIVGLESLCNSNHTDTMATGYDLIVANRQGLISLIGYILLWLIGSLLGVSIRRGRLAGLVSLLCFWLAAFGVLHCFGWLEVSRRAANLGYVLWATSSFCWMLLVFLFANVAQNWLEDRANYVTATDYPDLYTVVNCHGMHHFLLANLLTGLINLSCNTMQLSALSSLVTIVLYTGATVVVVNLMNNHN